MTEPALSICMIDIDENMIEELWDAINQFEIEDLSKLKLEIWEIDDGHIVWELLEKDESNSWYEEEPDDLATMWADSTFLDVPYPKLTLFTYFYKCIDRYCKDKEKELTEVLK